MFTSTPPGLFNIELPPSFSVNKKSLYVVSDLISTSHSTSVDHNFPKTVLQSLGNTGLKEYLNQSLQTLNPAVFDLNLEQKLQCLPLRKNTLQFFLIFIVGQKRCIETSKS